MEDLAGTVRGFGRPGADPAVTHLERSLPAMEAPSGVRLSILIVSYNCRELLLGCLESVFATVRTHPFEVIVVDNASTDDSVREARERFPSVAFIENEVNQWFSGATNQAILASTGAYLLCLNPDAVCHPKAVDDLVAFLDSHPSVAVVGPRLLNGDGSLQPSCRNFLTSRRLVLQHGLPWRAAPNAWRKRTVLEYWDHDETIRVDWLIGACILVRRTAVEQVGLKDEGFPMFHEETDWCWRFRKAGWEVWFLHDASITHYGGSTTIRRWGRGLVLEFYRGKHRFIRKHYGLLPLLMHRSLLSVMLLARLTRALVLSRVGRSRREWREEITVLRMGLELQLGLPRLSK
jgi:GT2 family glycosyltransferase